MTTSSDELSSHQTDEFSLSDNEDEDESESEEKTPDISPERETAQSKTSCEFAGTCQMGTEPHTHYRKIISHFFGRNKSATKVFPDYVWVHYCRKHYQRARYRAGQWPFTQCDLLIESLSRMEDWGGVQSFEVILRRREQERRSNANTDGDASGSADSSPSLSGSGSAAKLPPIGRKNPRAVTAPVPDWLLERIGSGLTFGDIREIIRQIRRHMEDLQRDNEGGGERSTGDTQSDKAPKSKKGKARRGTSNSGSKRAPSPIRFPDIEILPKFKSWALEKHNVSRAKMKNDKEKNDPSTSGEKCSNRTSAAGSSPPPQGKRGTAKTTPTARQPVDRVNERGGVRKPRSKAKGYIVGTPDTYQSPLNGQGKGKGP